jgi:hypothetical protein
MNVLDGSNDCKIVGFDVLALPVENYFESRYYIELRKAHNLFESLVSRDTEAGRRSY